MTHDTRRYELLAADFSPIALLVLSGEGRIVRHANHAMASLLGVSGKSLSGHGLAGLSPDVNAGLSPLIEAVTHRGRPYRVPGLVLPSAAPAGLASTWDAVCAPLPADESRTLPRMLAIWLWPEDMGTAASRRVIEALHTAQRDALPRILPGFDVAAALVPSQPGVALGGDTFDVIGLGKGRWAVMMADVSGRGPAAAARAVMVRHSLRVLAAGNGPGEALSCLSRLLLADPSFTGFVTVFLGILHTASDILTYSVAGHEPSFLLRGKTGDIEELGGEGALPLAVDENARYSDRTTPITARDSLLLYTDGLTDTRRDDEFFEAKRVQAALRRYRDLPAPALVAMLLAEAEEWAGPNNLRDDTALLILRGQDA